MAVPSKVVLVNMNISFIWKIPSSKQKREKKRKIRRLRNRIILFERKWHLTRNLATMSPLTLFRMSFFGAAHGWGAGKKVPPPLHLPHTSYNDETWHSYILPKEDPKNIWITWHTPWVLLTSAFFHRKSANFAISRNTDIDCILIQDFYLF